MRPTPATGGPSISAGCSSCAAASPATTSPGSWCRPRRKAAALQRGAHRQHDPAFGAGHETTVNLIGNGLLALHRNPDQLRLLRNDPALIPNAVEEFLRYNSSVQVTGRNALEDVVVGGTPVAKGRGGAVLARRRQPRSRRLSRSRPARRHPPNIRPMSFGGGIHFCLGAQLARIEGRSPSPRCCAASPS